jgi:hypothetical protein
MARAKGLLFGESTGNVGDLVPPPGDSLVEVGERQKEDDRILDRREGDGCLPCNGVLG